MAKSILQEKDGCCFLCMLLHNNFRRYASLDEHHVFMGHANRRLSEKYGLKVYLCDAHHEHSKEAVHVNYDNQRKLQDIAQRKFEQKYSHEKFMEVFGRNYIIESQEPPKKQQPEEFGFKFLEE